MIDTEELKEFESQFDQLGITGEKEQKEIIEYFYQLGKIMYKINIRSYDEEN
ncbi:MAG: hypothetical protein K6E15_02195 [Prevotella sp.]|nr:hypothetical protein [Prevotella sp.]